MCTLILHLSKLYIGRERSSHEIGVVAKEAIYPGEILAHIPRTAILTASTSCVSHVIKSDNDLCSHLPNTSSWVPLLIALIGEYAQKVNIDLVIAIFN